MMIMGMVDKISILAIKHTVVGMIVVLHLEIYMRHFKKWAEKENATTVYCVALLFIVAVYQLLESKPYMAFAQIMHKFVFAIHHMTRMIEV